MNPRYFSLTATALKPQQISMFLHVSARFWECRWSPHISEQKGPMLKPQLLYPPYPKDRGMLWFYVEAARRPPPDRPSPAARRPPPAARRPQWCDNSNTTGWIVLKFGIHIGSDSVLTWLTFQGRSSKVKVTASENDVIVSTFLNFHFLSHFPPKPSWGGHSNTPQQ